MENGGSEGFPFPLFPYHSSTNSAFIVLSSICNVAQSFPSHLDGLFLKKFVWRVPTHAITDRLSLHVLDLLGVGSPYSFCQPLQGSVSTTQGQFHRKKNFSSVTFTFRKVFLSEDFYNSQRCSMLSFNWKEDSIEPCAPYTINSFLRCNLRYFSNLND